MKGIRKAIIGYGFILPSLSIIAIFELWPIVYSLYLSFHEFNFVSVPKFIGIQNYERLVSHSLFWKSLWNTFYYTLGYLGLAVPISLALAIVLDTEVKFKDFFKTCYFLPLIVGGVAMILLWEWMYDYKYGILNYCLRFLQLKPRPWLNSPTWAMPALIFMSALGFGLNMILFLAGLQSIPPQLYEAARIDGASRLSEVRYITLPLLRPIMAFVLITSMIGGFQMFDQSFVLTDGGPLNSTYTTVFFIYDQSFRSMKVGYAAAATYVLFGIILALSFIQLKYVGSEV